jgi:hypothetical protein
VAASLFVVFALQPLIAKAAAVASPANFMATNWRDFDDDKMHSPTERVITPPIGGSRDDITG